VREGKKKREKEKRIEGRDREEVRERQGERAGGKERGGEGKRESAHAQESESERDRARKREVDIALQCEQPPARGGDESHGEGGVECVCEVDHVHKAEQVVLFAHVHQKKKPKKIFK